MALQVCSILYVWDNKHHHISPCQLADLCLQLVRMLETNIWNTWQSHFSTVDFSARFSVTNITSHEAEQRDGPLLGCNTELANFPFIISFLLAYFKNMGISKNAKYYKIIIIAQA